MGPTYYVLPRHNLTQYATPAQGGAIDVVDGATVATGYSAAWIGDGDPARPLRLNEASGRVRVTLPDSIVAGHVVDGVAIFAHNLTSCSVHASPTSTIAGADIGQIIPWPAGGTWHLDNYFTHVWLDLRSLYPPSFRQRKYWFLTMTTSAPISVGEWWIFSNLRQLPYSINWEAARGLSYGTKELVTESRQRVRYGRNARERTLKGSTTTIKPSQHEEMLQWIEDCRTSLTPTLVIPPPVTAYPSFVGAASFLNAEPMLMQFSEDEIAPTRSKGGVLTWPLALAEVSQGAPTVI